ncbi:putative Sma protein [Babesia divergens]|uniref:Sma protein n=1 Tax=Babesia divergens TaxID=32595 RepID=A0AAD9LJ95_BABDI|nr:putative Sma protein [Babesia divergens]
MVKLEVWEQKSSVSANDTESSDEDVKRIPLFDRLLPKATVARPVKSEGTVSESGSDSADYDNFFESDFSDATEEPVSEGTAYAEDWRQLQALRAKDKVSSAAYNDYRALPRAWDSVFYISSMHNLENANQHFFYCIKVKHVNDEVSKASGLGNITMYTPHFTLKPGECVTLQTPMFIWKKRRLTLAYGQLQHYVVKIELWKTHRMRINTLYGVQQMTFQEIIEHHSNFSITINLHIPDSAIERAAPANNRNKGQQATAITEATERRVPMHKVSVFLLLEEVFDFYFLFENWWFTMSPEMPDTLKELPKTLKLSVPMATGGRWDTKSTNASVDAFWSSPGVFCFQGTLRQLRYACFSAKMYCVHKRKFLAKPPTLLGTCIVSLKSVQEQPLVRGVVKKLTLGTRNMFSGTVQGNIRCCVKSCTSGFFEDLKTRPAQPISGSALITQLDHRCQYLIIRVVKCENLPATNTDSNTADPMVKVKWDGIVNYTAIVESTIFPVYNQNMYFPIHLVDERELTDPALIKHSLPVDLKSKGPVVVEVWDHDDASSDFLGSVEIPLSKIYTHGVLQQRSLVDGIYTEVSQEKYRRSDDSDEDGDVEVLYTGDNASNVPYRKHVTRLFSDSLPLSGATVAHRGKKPTISVEMYIIPPMPNDLYIPEDQTKHMRTDIYRDLSRRWKKEYDTWQAVYNERFPGAVSRRRFTCVTRSASNFKDNFPSDVIPLCYFIKPIQMYIQLSPPGELMHWISNFTFKDDGMSTIGGFISIDTWQMPSRFVLTRKGGLQDRAVLLCSCLLGLGYDAYVCKGTVKGGKQEHCWVMTRHKDQTVTFWETANKRMWHLPRRWQTQNFLVAEKPEDVMNSSGNYAQLPTKVEHNKDACTSTNQGRQQAKHKLMNYELYGNEYMADVKVELNNILNSKDIVSYDVTSLPVQSEFYGAGQSREGGNKRLSLIDPKPHLLIPKETLIYVPYSSIEVIFNDKQLWGNLQNHHPACITYDLERPDEWKPFLKVPLDDSIMPDVQITAPVSEIVCANAAKDIKNDIVEMIELMHAQNGRVPTFTHDQQMDEHLESFIDILEFRQRLDMQFDPGMPPHLFGWSVNRRKRSKRTTNTTGAEEKCEQTNIDEPQQDVGANIMEQSVSGSIDATSLQAKCESSQLNEKVAKLKDEADDEGSDTTTASTDDSIIFDPQPMPIRNMAAADRQRQTRPLPLQRRRMRRGIHLGSKIKAIFSAAPRHRAMPQDDEDILDQTTSFDSSWRGKLSAHGFRLKRPSVVIRAPKVDILKLLSHASMSLKMESSDEFKDCIEEVHDSGSEKSVFTPMSCVNSASHFKDQFNHELYYKQCIDSAVHRKAPIKDGSRRPQHAQITAKAPQKSSLQSKGTAMGPRKPTLLKKLLRKVKIYDIPEPHKMPRFMMDMQQVVQESGFLPHYLEHKYPIPYEFNVYRSQQISKWNWYYNMEARQYAWRSHLPIPPNHTFIGIPIHFCSSDMNEIRHMLTSNNKFKKLLVPDVERCINVIYVKVFPLLGSVLSTWVFLGCHVPWNTR